MITNCVRTLRKTNGYNLTQAELARQIGVARQTIVELENGRSPSADLLLRISNIFLCRRRTFVVRLLRFFQLYRGTYQKLFLLFCGLIVLIHTQRLHRTLIKEQHVYMSIEVSIR